MSSNFEENLSNNSISNNSQIQCVFCPKLRSFASTSLMLNKALYLKYSSSQNYYYSKDISELLDQNTKKSEIILFHYQNAFEEEKEYLSRLYNLDELDYKINYLTEYYKYHKEVPRLFMQPAANSMNNFHDKKRRIEYFRIKRMLIQQKKGVVTNEEESERLTTEENQESINSKSSNLNLNELDHILDGVITQNPSIIQNNTENSTIRDLDLLLNNEKDFKKNKLNLKLDNSIHKLEIPKNPQFFKAKEENFEFKEIKLPKENKNTVSSVPNSPFQNNFSFKDIAKNLNVFNKLIEEQKKTNIYYPNSIGSHRVVNSIDFVNKRITPLEIKTSPKTKFEGTSFKNSSLLGNKNLKDLNSNSTKHRRIFSSGQLAKKTITISSPIKPKTQITFNKNNNKNVKNINISQEDQKTKNNNISNEFKNSISSSERSQHQKNLKKNTLNIDFKSVLNLKKNAILNLSKEISKQIPKTKVNEKNKPIKDFSTNKEIKTNNNTSEKNLPSSKKIDSFSKEKNSNFSNQSHVKSTNISNRELIYSQNISSETNSKQLNIKKATQSNHESKKIKTTKPISTKKLSLDNFNIRNSPKTILTSPNLLHTKKSEKDKKMSLFKINTDNINLINPKNSSKARMPSYESAQTPASSTIRKNWNFSSHEKTELTKAFCTGNFEVLTPQSLWNKIDSPLIGNFKINKNRKTQSQQFEKEIIKNNFHKNTEGKKEIEKEEENKKNQQMKINIISNFFNFNGESEEKQKLLMKKIKMEFNNLRKIPDFKLTDIQEITNKLVGQNKSPPNSFKTMSFSKKY